MRNEVVFLESSLGNEMLPQIMILWWYLAFLASCSVASRPRGIRAEVNIKKTFFGRSPKSALRWPLFTTPDQISDVSMGATLFRSSKSTTTTVIVRLTI